MKDLCPFCSSDEEYRCLYEADLAKVIYPLNPINRLHFLLVPKRHVQLLHQLTDEEMLDIHQALRDLELYVTNKFTGVLGYNLESNNGGPAVNQQVPHAHIHVFFREESDNDPFEKRSDSVLLEFTKEQLGLINELKSELHHMKRKVY